MWGVCDVYGNSLDDLVLMFHELTQLSTNKDFEKSIPQELIIARRNCNRNSNEKLPNLAQTRISAVPILLLETGIAQKRCKGCKKIQKAYNLRQCKTPGSLTTP